MTVLELEHTLDDLTRRIVREFHPDRIVLFGSRARGTATAESDLDILVIMPVEGSVRDTACAIGAALSDRMFSLDLIVMTPEQYSRQKELQGTIANEAAHDGRILYERIA